MRSVLFVCLGNICRSPTAEGVARRRAEARGLAEGLTIDSAGTSGYHAGERADARMRKHAARRGYDLQSRARAFDVGDFDRFDIVVAMDRSNHENLEAMARGEADLAPMDDYPIALEAMQALPAAEPDDRIDYPF